MNFREAEAYLLSLGNEVETMKLGLDRIRRLLSALGDPQNNYLKIQVAGTNGKGSVCAFLRSICFEAGIKAGVFTSPHLISIAERINIGGIDIGEEDFARFATKVRETSEQLAVSGEIDGVPTFFEQVTAIALLAFAHAKVHLAILETGLGGRLDATTAANAEIAAITRIDYDHQEYLGETIEEIAAEKAAIIRPDSIVVLTHQTRTVEQFLAGRCRAVGVEPHWASAEFRFKDGPEIAPALLGSIATSKAHYGFLELWNMLGRHQYENAAIAIGVAEILSDRGFRISPDQISLGIETASHSGRLEAFPPNFLFDGAHNVGGAQALRDFLEEFETRPTTMIFGAMKDKNVADIIRILEPVAEHFVFTRPENERAFPANELEKFVSSSYDRSCVMSTNSVSEALAKAAELSQPDSTIVVTGSLYLVGEVKKKLNN